MTPDDIRAARGRLGDMWGLGRPLRAAELGRALRLKGRDPGQSVHDWERGNSAVTGPVAVAVAMMLAGAMPPDPLADIMDRRQRS